MTDRRRRFLRWFAARDLYEENALRTTLVNRGSITLLTALTVASFALALAHRELRVLRLKRRPLALCLTIGNPNVAPQFTPDRLEHLRGALEGDDRVRGEYRGPYPFHEVTALWHSPIDRRPVDCFGRTVGLGEEGSVEPVLQGIAPLAHGTGLSPTNPDGVIVTEALVRALYGLGPQDPLPTELPAELTLQLPRGPVSVRLAGVTAAVLPQQHQFILSEQFEERLNTELRSRVIFSGEVPASWPKSLFALPASAKRLASRPEYDIRRITPARIDGRSVWEIESGSARPLRMETWRRLLEDLRGAVEKTHERAPGFVPAPSEPVHAPLAQEERPEPRPAYGMATLYARDVYGLRPLADVAESEGFPVLRDTMSSLEQIDAESRMTLGGILLIAGLLLVNSCANLRVIQKLRSEQKLTEIGMLKALGMDEGLLRQVHLHEAYLVWRGGTVRGLFWGLLIALAAGASFLTSDPRELAEVVFNRWFGAAAVLIPMLTYLSFRLSSLSGTREAREKAPILTLKTN